MKRIAIATLAGGLLAACGKGPPPDTTVAPASTVEKPPRGGPVPLDHLANGELAEGKESMFGLPMPHIMRMQLSFPSEALAVGEVEPELVANYVRARVSGGKLSVGASQTLFEDVHVGTETRPLRIRIERLRGVCRLEVRDMTPPPPLPGPVPQNDAERWRQAGYGPDGRPLDPMHMK